jgi:SPP1 family predicted phage head-tail adaptor
MKAGKLRHRVEIYKPTFVKDDIGNHIPTWVKVAEAWAAIEPLKGDERWAAAYAQATTTHRVTMRPPGIAVHPSNRLVFNGRIFEIEAVLDIEERGRELQLMCVEKVE